MKQHPLSAAFPAMPEDELASLAEDIRANGLREPGVIFEGKILDGWHRFQACERAGAVFKSFPLPAGRDPRALVKSRNLHRRHLTASQRASAVVACSEWAPVGRPINGAAAALFNSAAAAGLSAAKLAKEADVSVRTIENAKAAHKAGLSGAVTSGKVTAERAAEIAKLPKAKQEKALAAGKVKTAKKPTRLEAENESLKVQVDELSENLPELTAMASAAEAMKNDEHFKRIMHLETELRSVKKRRDELMRENSELKTQIKFWKRKAEKK